MEQVQQSWHGKTMADDHREQLFATLRQLKQLSTLKLQMVDKAHWYHNIDKSLEARCWTSYDMEMLLRLPLTHLAVQHVSDAAGKALTVLVEAEECTLRTLKLGNTMELDWTEVMQVADQLDQVLLPKSRQPRTQSGRRMKPGSSRIDGRRTPANITFYDKWEDML